MANQQKILRMKYLSIFAVAIVGAVLGIGMLSGGSFVQRGQARTAFGGCGIVSVSITPNPVNASQFTLTTELDQDCAMSGSRPWTTAAVTFTGITPTTVTPPTYVSGNSIYSGTYGVTSASNGGPYQACVKLSPMGSTWPAVTQCTSFSVLLSGTAGSLTAIASPTTTNTTVNIGGSGVGGSFLTYNEGDCPDGSLMKSPQMNAGEITPLGWSISGRPETGSFTLTTTQTGSSETGCPGGPSFKTYRYSINSFAINISSFPAGTYTVALKADDGAGNTIQATTSFTVPCYASNGYTCQTNAGTCAEGEVLPVDYSTDCTPSQYATCRNTGSGTCAEPMVIKCSIVAASYCTASATSTPAAAISLSPSSLSATAACVGSSSISISPATATVQVGQTQQFTVTGVSSVNWSVNGISGSGSPLGTAGGNSTVGTISPTASSTGTYTAPAVVPSPATVTVTATDGSDPTQSASASVTVIASATVAITPNPPEPTPVGLPIDFSCSGGSGSYNWSSGSATPLTQTGGSDYSPSYSTAGTYTVTCTDPVSGGSATAPVIIVAPDCTFAASPTQIVGPQTTTLSWNCTNATSCNVNGTPVSPTNGSLSVSPTQNTTYILSCSGAGSGPANSISIQAPVTVSNPAVHEGP